MSFITRGKISEKVVQGDKTKATSFVLHVTFSVQLSSIAVEMGQFVAMSLGTKSKCAHESGFEALRWLRSCCEGLER
jgi:hypothetical protein